MPYSSSFVWKNDKNWFNIYYLQFGSANNKRTMHFILSKLWKIKKSVELDKVNTITMINAWETITVSERNSRHCSELVTSRLARSDLFYLIFTILAVSFQLCCIFPIRIMNIIMKTLDLYVIVIVAVTIKKKKTTHWLPHEAKWLQQSF